MITPATYNDLPWFAGDSFLLRLNWKDNDGLTKDLTGYGGSFKLMYSPIEDLIVLEITESTGITFSATSPNIQISKSKNLTTLTPVPLYYTFEVIDLSGIRSRLLQGTVQYKDTCDT